MALYNWVLPILIGILASYLLMSILYQNPKVKQAFSDLGALIQLQTSRPVYYGVGWIPTSGYPSGGEPIPVITQGAITTDSTFNYYPKTPLNPSAQGGSITAPANTAPENVYDAHKAYYWALSGGYPYPYMMPAIYAPSAVY